MSGSLQELLVRQFNYHESLLESSCFHFQTYIYNSLQASFLKGIMALRLRLVKITSKIYKDTESVQSQNVTQSDAQIMLE